MVSVSNLPFSPNLISAFLLAGFRRCSLHRRHKLTLPPFPVPKKKPLFF